MSDPRLTPANHRVAHESLRGKMNAPRYVEGQWKRVRTDTADILRAPFGARDRQALYGERLLVLDQWNDHAFIQAERDGYVGYVSQTALHADADATHWVSNPGTHIYPEPNFKTREVATLSLGARVTVTGTERRFHATDQGGFIPSSHLRKLGDWKDDPVEIASLFLGTPYLWGGNTRAGIDCSGLIQASLLATGTRCPADSDMQDSIGSAVPDGAPPKAGDLLFWKGHVAMAVDETTLIHANAHHMAVVYEGIEEAITRITTQGDGPVTARRRL